METQKIRKIITIGLFVGLGIIDYVVSSLDGMTQQIARNFVAAGLFGIMCINMEKPTKMIKIITNLLTCGLVAFIVIPFVTHYGNASGIRDSLTCLPLYCAISAGIIVAFWVNKDKAIALIKNKYVWTYFLLYILIVISKSDSKWPLSIIPMVLCISVVLDSTERVNLFFHELNLGIIITFFLIQGCAFVFRPYDIVRYVGMYTNCNINALFYLCAFVAFLCETFYSTKKESRWWRIVCMIMSPICIGFTVFTVCRTAVIAEALVCFALLFVYIVRKTQVKKLLANIGIFVMAVFISIPIVYCAIRYIPAIFHHPIWLWDEYSESKVHSFDPVNSEKYISGKEAGIELVRRYLWFSDEAMEWVANETPVADSVSEETKEVIIDPRIKELLDAGVVPVLSHEESMHADSVRIGIWKGYIRMLNICGHKKEEGELLLEDDYIAPHAHNVFIMSAFDYGLFAGIVFCVIAIFTLSKGILMIAKKKSEYLGVVVAFSSVAFYAFGFFETNWGLGKMSMLCFLLIQIIVPRRISTDDCTCERVE